MSFLPPPRPRLSAEEKLARVHQIIRRNIKNLPNPDDIAGLEEVKKRVSYADWIILEKYFLARGRQSGVMDIQAHMFNRNCWEDQEESEG